MLQWVLRNLWVLGQWLTMPIGKSNPLNIPEKEVYLDSIDKELFFQVIPTVKEKTNLSSNISKKRPNNNPN